MHSECVQAEFVCAVETATGLEVAEITVQHIKFPAEEVKAETEVDLFNRMRGAG